MDDFYSEQEQWERFKGWLRDNGLWLLAGVLIGVGLLYGWNAYKARVERRAVEASSKYQEALDAFDRNDKTRAFTLIDELHRDYASSPYADQADLAAARAHVFNNELPKAADRLSAVMNGSKDVELRLVARLRLSQVQLAQGKPDDALATLAAATPGGFTPRFAELRGDILLAKNDRAGALREYRSARTSSAPGVIDEASVDLKIGDLVADGVIAK